ncbi:hypothetical protein [Slackia isoflavoniconvertens]|uniref:hypothetical protein n=1 Tax=Slackia isoflavoniconvertens TaxID=572010 RepID=UPI00248ECC9E|nr:hypothetical protein [Slackia isoflavoniconvertens]
MANASSLEKTIASSAIISFFLTCAMTLPSCQSSIETDGQPAVDQAATERIKSGYYDHRVASQMTNERFDQLITDGLDYAEGSYPEANILIANNTVVEGLASHGFASATAQNSENAPSTSDTTWIHYYDDQYEQAAAQIAAILNLDNTAVSGPHDHRSENSSEEYDVIVNLGYDATN